MAAQNEMICWLVRKMVDDFESRTSSGVRLASSRASVSEVRTENEFLKNR